MGYRGRSCDRHPLTLSVASCSRCGRAACQECATWSRLRVRCRECADRDGRWRRLRRGARLGGVFVVTLLLGLLAAAPRRLTLARVADAPSDETGFCSVGVSLSCFRQFRQSIGSRCADPNRFCCLFHEPVYSADP